MLSQRNHPISAPPIMGSGSVTGIRLGVGGDKNNSKNELVLIQWNSQSIRNKKNDFVNYIYDSGNNIDIVLLSETWLVSDDSFHIKGYNIHRADRTDIRGGGVAILISKGLSFTPVKIRKNFNSDIEVCAVLVDNVGVTFVSIYKPPDVRATLQDWEHLFAQFSENSVIGGDLNGHHQTWGASHTDAQGIRILEALDSANLMFLNDGTHTTMSRPGRRSSAIDLTIMPHNLITKSSWEVHCDALGSYHFPIKINISLNYKVDALRPTTRWKVEGADWPTFSRTLSNFDTNDHEYLNNSQKYNRFVNKLEEACSLSMPVKKTFVPKNLRPLWWDEECTNIVKKRKDTLSTYKRNSNLENYVAFKNVEAQSKRLFKQKSRDCWRSYISKLNTGTPITNVWKMVRGISNKNKKQNSSALPDSLIEDALDRLAPASAQGDFDGVLANNLNNITTLDNPFSFQELSKSIKNSKSTAPGKDNFTYPIIRNLPDNIMHYFLEILNNWWIKGDTFDQLKEVVICLLLKPKKDPESITSYRPISLMSCLAKTFERMVKLRLECYLEYNSMFPRNQFGFRRGMGTMDALSKLVTSIQLALTKKQYVGLLFADIEGAYDVVDLSILANKLFELRLSRNVVNGILRLFSSRKIFVRDRKGALHGPRVSNQGLMQGSVLSPILFNIYTFSLHTLWEEDVTCIQYADDICIFAVKNSLQECKAELENIVKTLQPWMSNHGFNMAPQKCAVMICSRSRNLQHRAEASISLSGMTFPLVNSFKYLGLILDSRLQWRDHIIYTVNRCEGACNVLKCTTKHYWGADRQTALLFYKSYVRSMIDYGSLFYGSASKTNLRHLDRVQYKCLRIVLGAMRSTPCPILLAEAGEPPLHLRRLCLARRFITKITFFDISGLIVDVCNLTTLTLTHSYWGKKRDPLLCQAYLDLSDCKQFIDSTKTYPIFQFPLDIFTYTPEIQYPSYSDYNNLNNFIYEDSKKVVDAIQLFTDGSRSNSGVGCAVYSPSGDIKIRFRLHKLCSIYTAEGFAIWKALDWALRSSTGNVIIITDSKSVLDAIDNFSVKHFKDNIIINILNLCVLLAASGRLVQFIWCKGHAGITGNETVDSLAKEAVEDGETIYFLTPSDIRAHFDKLLMSSWGSEWSKFVENSRNQYVRLHSALPSVTPYPQCSRFFTSTIFRLKVQHGRFPSHLHKIGITETPSCSCDGVAIGDLNHILFECGNNLNASHKLLSEFVANGVVLPTNLSCILAEENMTIFKNLVQFFSDIGMKL